MALYQPSNITPSSFAGIGAGVIDASDNVSISWQVNGTSAMTGFTVKVYRNTTVSSLVHTFTETLSEPFYGTDASGNPVYFVYEPGTTWALAGLSNGNGYKLQITQNWLEGSTSKSVVQTSESVFIARAKPSLSVSPASGTLTTVAQTFTGTYSQTQGDAISWVRWVLSDANGNALDDTGEVYTGLLSYSYDGFFTGETYTLSCTVETSSGAEVTVTNTYAVSYESAEQTGGISLSCNADDSVTLKWSAGADIPGVPSAEDYGTISGGVLHLAASRSILWSQVNGAAMSFPSPYCFAWRGTISETTTEDVTVNSGTWVVESSGTVTNTKNATKTTSSWTRNPSVPDNLNTTETFSVNASTRRTVDAYPLYTGNLNNIKAPEGYASDTITVSSQAPITDIRIWYGAALEIETYKITDLSYTVVLYSTTADIGTSYSVTLKVTSEYYLASETKTASHTRISNPVVLSTSAQSATVNTEGSSGLAITALAYSSGTYTVTISYDYDNQSTQKYYYKYQDTLGVSGGTLTSASIISTTADGGATVSANKTTSGSAQQNTYAVTVYNSTGSGSVTTTVRLTYTTTVPAVYKTTVTGTKTGATSASVVSTTATSATVSIGANGSYTVTMRYSSATSRSAVIRFGMPSTMTLPDLATISDGTNSAVISTDGTNAVLTINSTEASSIPIPGNAWNMLVVARASSMDAIFFDNEGSVIGQGTDEISGTMPSPVSSVRVDGEQDCDYIYFSSNEDYDFAAAGYTPGWDGNSLFYASFASDLQAGTVSDDSALSVAIYRREGNALFPVGVFGSGVKSVRDYAIRSGVEYLYEMFYIASGIYSAGAESETMCKRFRQHTLIEAEEDPELPGVYHPVNVWRFRDNVDAGAYTNQNQPVMLENFTAYPLWQPSSPRAKSGTLVALLGRFVSGVYTGDNAGAMGKLFALSSSVNPLFYRDMKGNLYMVRLAGPISQTINNQTGVLEVSVSVPWVEVGDADNVKIYTTEG